MSSAPHASQGRVGSTGATIPGAGLAELTARVRGFARERDWEQFHTPKNLAMALAGEVGELLAELQWLTPEQSTTVMTDPVAGARVAAEVGDVMIYLVRLADTLGIDLVAAAHEKLTEAGRRYPVESARGSAVKAPAPASGTDPDTTAGPGPLLAS